MTTDETMKATRLPGDGLVPHVCVLREVCAAVRPLAALAGRLQEGRGIQEVHPRQDDQRREGHVSCCY